MGVVTNSNQDYTVQLRVGNRTTANSKKNRGQKADSHTVIIFLPSLFL